MSVEKGRQRVYRSGHCSLCGTWRVSLHRDHIVPRSKGGDDAPSNLQFICANCHEDKTREESKGRQFTAEHRARLSAAHLGKPSVLRGRVMGPLSVEHRAKISAAIAGQPKSLEHRAKLSEARSAWWQRRRANNVD